MPHYLLIKLLLLCALIIICLILIRPVRSANKLALRRFTMIFGLGASFIAILFPSLLNKIATMIGVSQGINLLVYILFVTLFILMAVSYRHDIDTERKLTRIARAVAIADARGKYNGTMIPLASNPDISSAKNLSESTSNPQVSSENHHISESISPSTEFRRDNE